MMFIPSGKVSGEAEWDYKYAIGIKSVGLSQLCFENCQLCFWAVLKNSAYYAQNYAPKIKIMLEIWLFY